MGLATDPIATRAAIATTKNCRTRDCNCRKAYLQRTCYLWHWARHVAFAPGTAFEANTSQFACLMPRQPENNYPWVLQCLLIL
jgi:hypothetical protein